MTTREHAPVGAPCWADLWTSEVEGSRRFYAELFGWEAAEPSEEFGGYFMFLRDGVPVVGGMGPMGDMPAGNVWTVYLATDDIAAAAAAQRAEAGSDEQVAGVMDATAWLPEDGAAVWSIYFDVEDARAAADRVVELGGSIIDPAVDTPYGVLATMADPAGAVFKLRTTPAS